MCSQFQLFEFFSSYRSAFVRKWKQLSVIYCFLLGSNSRAKVFVSSQFLIPSLFKESTFYFVLYSLHMFCIFIYFYAIFSFPFLRTIFHYYLLTVSSITYCKHIIFSVYKLTLVKKKLAFVIQFSYRLPGFKWPLMLSNLQIFVKQWHPLIHSSLIQGK